jgi:hypothetical protein
MINLNMNYQLDDSASQMEQYTLLNVQPNRKGDSKILSFDAIFFTEPTQVGKERFYKLFVRIDATSEYTFPLDKRIEIIGDTSYANFELMGENSGPTKIKTINDEDTLKLEHQIIRQEFDYRWSEDETYRPLFYCLKIPEAKLKWGELNRIRYSGSISATNNLGQVIGGEIQINLKNHVTAFPSGRNEYTISQLNNVIGFFQYDANEDAPHMRELTTKSIIVDDNSTTTNFIYREDYALRYKYLKIDNDKYYLDKTIQKCIDDNIADINKINNPTSNSTMKVDETTGHKTKDYYDFEKPNNVLSTLDQNHFELENTDHTFMNMDTRQVKKTDINSGDAGILLNPDFEGNIHFIDDVNLAEMEVVIDNSLATTKNAVEIMSDSTLELDSPAVSYLVNIVKSEVASATYEDLKGYIKQHEEILK